MKKMIMMLIVLTLAIGFCGCVSNSSSSNDTTEDTEDVVYGYNDEYEDEYNEEYEDFGEVYDEDYFDESPRTVMDDGVERTAGTLCFYMKDGSQYEMTVEELCDAYYTNPYAAREQYRNSDIEKIVGYDVVESFGSDGHIFFESGVSVGDEYFVEDPEYPSIGMPGDFVEYEADFLSSKLDDEDSEHAECFYGNGQVLRYWR